MDDLSTNAGFGRFFAEHRETLEGVAFRMTGDRDLAQDVVADAATRVWQRFQVEVAQHPLAYLYRAVQNGARDQVRRRRIEHWQPSRLEGIPAPAEPLRFDDRDALLRVLPRLPERQRVTLELRYLDDRSDEDIAQRLGVHPVTVRTIAHRALRRLRHEYPVAVSPAVAD